MPNAMCFDDILPGQWRVVVQVDADGHLNIYVNNDDQSGIIDVDSGASALPGEEMHLRLTTAQIEQEYENEA